MWTYEQSTGWLIDATGRRFGPGYSGAPGGRNDPEKEAMVDLGPIPRGRYVISAPVDTVTHGPYVLALVPDPANSMFGRGGFLIHGDSVVEPGTASKGCIIMPHVVRQQVWESDDHELGVV